MVPAISLSRSGCFEVETSGSRKSGVQDAGYGMQDTGCGVRDAGCGMRDAGCGMRDGGCGMETHGTTGAGGPFPSLRSWNRAQQTKHPLGALCALCESIGTYGSLTEPRRSRRRENSAKRRESRRRIQSTAHRFLAKAAKPAKELRISPGKSLTKSLECALVLRSWFFVR